MIKSYIRIPIVVQAIQITKKNKREIFDFLNSNVEGWHLFDTHYKSGIIIPTPDGDMLAKINDWLLINPEGIVSPCPPEIFEKAFELFDMPIIDLESGEDNGQ